MVSLHGVLGCGFLGVDGRDREKDGGRGSAVILGSCLVRGRFYVNWNAGVRCGVGAVVVVYV